MGVRTHCATAADLAVELADPADLDVFDESPRPVGPVLVISDPGNMEEWIVIGDRNRQAAFACRLLAAATGTPAAPSSLRTVADLVDVARRISPAETGLDDTTLDDTASDPVLAAVDIGDLRCALSTLAELWSGADPDADLSEHQRAVTDKVFLAWLDEPEPEPVTCKFCGNPADAATARRHQGTWVGQCCWDERLRATQ